MQEEFLIEAFDAVGGRADLLAVGDQQRTHAARPVIDAEAVAHAVKLLEIGEFDLIISFANPMAGEDWTTTTVTLKGCIFTEDCLESQQDDTNITHEFDLNPFDIQIGSGDTI